MAEDIKKTNDEIADYSASLAKGYSAICDLLRSEIEQALHGAMSKLYHSAPVWFIDSIPVVGYNATQQSVTLLFGSGQSFNEPDLTPTGKFKAAQNKISERERHQYRIAPPMVGKVQRNHLELQRSLENRGVGPVRG